MSEKKNIEHSKHCDNCKKQIPQNKYSLHVITCKELNIQCELCEAIINKYETDEHNEEFHLLVDCLDCGKKFEKRSVDSHKKKCLHKPTACQYCDLKVGKTDLHEHEYLCGSKTERCINCEKFVQIREFDLHLLYECDKNKNQLNVDKNQNDNLSLTEKLIKSSSSILHDSKNVFCETFLDNYIPISKSKNEFRKANKIIKDEEEPYNSSQQNKKETLDFKVNNNFNKEKENKKMIKPNPIKSEDFYNLKPIAKNSTIIPITFTKQSILKNKNYVNPQNKEKIENKKEMNKNTKKILDEINSEYDLINKNLNSNIYNPNKENFNDNIIEVEEFYNDCEAFGNNFLSEKANSSPNKNPADNNIKINKVNNRNKKERNDINLSDGDFPDYHLLQNYQEDIAYDYSELMKILEKSKYEK